MDYCMNFYLNWGFRVHVGLTWLIVVISHVIWKLKLTWLGYEIWIPCVREIMSNWMRTEMGVFVNTVECWKMWQNTILVWTSWRHLGYRQAMHQSRGCLARFVVSCVLGESRVIFVRIGLMVRGLLFRIEWTF